MGHLSAFKTPEGQARYLAAYDAALKLWPVPYDEIDVSTRFGTTHVVVSGPKDAPPLVLLHGYMATSVMWSPNMIAFSRDYLGMKHFRIPPDTVRVTANALSEDELRALQVPVLFLMGEDDVLCDAATALARARRLIPDFQGELVRGCRHDMCFSQHRIVDARVLDFLKRTNAEGIDDHLGIGLVSAGVRSTGVHKNTGLAVPA